MKKYIQPQSQLLTFECEGVIATSLGFHDKPGNQQLSNERNGWNSDDWNTNSFEE